MKVLLINGSPHKEGCTFTALTEIKNQFEKEGIDSEIFWIGNKPVRGCIACLKCGHGDGKCAFDDDPANEIAEKINETSDFNTTIISNGRNEERLKKHFSNYIDSPNFKIYAKDIKKYYKL